MAIKAAAPITGKAKVLVVDDHPVVREGLAMLIGMQNDLQLCGQAEDVADALDMMADDPPDAAVVDISLKSGNGIDLIKRMRARSETVRIVVWSMHSELLYAERALRAGAMGYVHKGRATREIIDALHTVLQGRLYVHPDLAERLLQRVMGPGHADDRAPVESLSDREFEAFHLIGMGLTTHQIAEKMHVSPKTVETFRARIKEKLGVANMPELIQRAVQWTLENGGEQGEQ